MDEKREEINGRGWDRSRGGREDEDIRGENRKEGGEETVKHGTLNSMTLVDA